MSLVLILLRNHTNSPEKYRVGDVIYTLKAFDNDGGDLNEEKQSLTYKILGPFKEQ